MEKQDWFNEESEITDPIAVEELERICADAREKDTEIKKMEADVKEEKAILSKMKSRILMHLDNLGKTKYISDSGTFYKKTKFSVTTPKTEDEKRAFFDFCKEKEIYWKYASVNSSSLQTLYKSMLEEVGPEFVMPGVGEPKHFEELAMRKK